MKLPNRKHRPRNQSASCESADARLLLSTTLDFLYKPFQTKNDQPRRLRRLPPRRTSLLLNAIFEHGRPGTLNSHLCNCHLIGLVVIFISISVFLFFALYSSLCIWLLVSSYPTLMHRSRYPPSSELRLGVEQWRRRWRSFAHLQVTPDEEKPTRKAKKAPARKNGSPPPQRNLRARPLSAAE